MEFSRLGTKIERRIVEMKTIESTSDSAGCKACDCIEFEDHSSQAKELAHKLLRSLALEKFYYVLMGMAAGMAVPLAFIGLHVLLDMHFDSSSVTALFITPAFAFASAMIVRYYWNKTQKDLCGSEN